MSNDDRKVLELERDLEGVLDEDSISQMLDGFQPSNSDERRRSHQPSRPRKDTEQTKTLEVDSEILIGAAPSSEAQEDSPTIEAQISSPTLVAQEESPTIEAYVGEAPDAHMPEAAVVMPRKRKDARKFPAQPPPLPGSINGSARHRHRAPAKPPESAPTRTKPAGGDLRPTDRAIEKRWELDQTDLASVLLELVAKPGLSLLEMRAGKRRAQLVIENGRVFEVRLLPALAKRSLTAFLQRDGRLSPKHAAQFRRRAREKGISEVQALLQAPTIISSNAVRSAVCSRTRHLLRRLLSAKLSRADLYILDDASDAAMLVSVPLVGILFSHVRAAYSAKSSGRRNRARRGFEGKELSRRPNLAFSINQLDLKLHERQLIDRVLTKPRRFDRVLRNSPVSEDDTVALLAALNAVGLLQVKAPGISNLSNSSWAEDYADTLERIELMEARLERENLFALFGLHWTSYDAEVERTYSEISRIFKIINQPLGLSKSERKRVRRIKKALDAAYDKLKNVEKREYYRKKLIGPRMRAKAAKKLEALGNAAFRRKALHSALDYYQRLLEIEPTHRDASRLLPLLIARTSRRR